MRIAQAIALYLPEFQGGATLVCDRLSRALAARGHTVEVFSGRTTAAEPLGALKRDMVGPFLTWRVNVGGALHPWSPENWDNPVATESFAEFLAATRPDVVHAHSLQGLGVGVVEAARAAGIPVVLTMHDWWWLCPCLFRLSPAGTMCAPIVRPGGCAGVPDGVDLEARRARLLAALEHVDQILTPSAYLRDSLIVNGLDGRRIAVQENGTPPPGELAGRGTARDGDGPLRAVFIGGAGNREKGLDVLLEAACTLPDGVVVHAYAVREEETARFAGRLGGRLVCHPPFAAAALDHVLADADVLVLPSLMRESFSLVAREALIRGVPVVTSDCGGPEEVVRDGENGLVVPSGVPAALAAALVRLQRDPELLRRLASAPRPRLATPDEQAADAERLYGYVVSAMRERRSAHAARERDDFGARRVLRRLLDLRSLLSLRPTEDAVEPRAGEELSPGGRRDGGSEPARRDVARAASPPRFGAGKRVLFLTGIDGAPLRYRVWHLAEQLAGAGVESAALYHSDERALAAARHADLIVLFRAPYSVSVAAVVAEARRRRVPVVFSIDDLVFRADALGDAAALEHARPEIAAGFRQSVEAYARSFAAADYFLGSTEELVRAATEVGATAFLHRNGVGSALLACAERARGAALATRFHAPTNGSGPRPVRLGFLSGTDTHDRDLAAIAAPLARLMERLPHVSLAVGGPVRVPESLEAFAERIERWPFVAWSDLAERVARLDVNLAPLELPNPFNQAKSEVKYLEAGAVQVPTVASPSDAFRIALDGGAGLLARDEDEWERALERLVLAHELRATFGRSARRDVYRRYSPLVQEGDLLAILDEIAARGPCREGPAPSPIAMEAGGGSSVALEPAAAGYDAYQLEAESGGPLGPGREVEQAFVCRADGLRRVDVMVGTYARRNQHRVVLEILDDQGVVRGRRELAAAKLVDRSFVSVSLDTPAADSGGRTFVLRASAPDARDGNEILLWHAPSPLGGLRIGGEELPGRTLAFRTFGRDVL
ncbi:MAG: glycosyltransferase [Thermodesulfobacteriota bacterium]